jgi:hypothetical protein
MGIDEISYRRGQKYATVVYDLDRSRVVWVGQGKGRDVIYSAFLRANYFFVSTDRRFGRGDFYKRVVGQGDVFHRDKVTSECRGGQLTQFGGYG